MLQHEKEHEREAFRQMSFKEKCVHVLTYYWIPIVAVIAGIVFLISMLNHYIFNPPKEPSLAIGLITDEYIYTQSDTLLNDLRQTFPELETPKEEITTTYFSMIEDEDMNYYYSSQQLLALVQAGALDVMIGTEGYMRNLAVNDFFYHMEDKLSPQQLEEWQVNYSNVDAETDALGRVIRVEGPYALLVPIPNTPMLAEIFGENANLFAGVLINSPHMEADLKLIEYLVEAN